MIVLEQRRVIFMGFLVQCPCCDRYYPQGHAHGHVPNVCWVCGDEIEQDMARAANEPVTSNG